MINGFFCFNSASQGAVSGADDAAVITKVLINTGLANSCGTLITLLVQEVILGVEPGYWLLLAVANGGLSGCVRNFFVDLIKVCIPNVVIIMFPSPAGLQI